MRKYLALVLVFIMVSGVCLLFSMRKEGMFIDEIYTYGLSNNVGGPFLRDMKGGNIVDTVFSREELIDYVAVTEGEGFDFASVYYNQVNDVPPALQRAASPSGQALRWTMLFTCSRCWCSTHWCASSGAAVKTPLPPLCSTD